VSALEWTAAIGPGAVLGAVVELFALALIPLVVLRRKEPSSTAAWILALVFLPGLGATLFLLFGRERVRLPVQWKREADRRHLEARQREVAGELPGSVRDPLAHVAALDAGDRPSATIDHELFRIGAALGGVAPTNGNTVTLLVDGDATYDAIGRAIDAATQYVYAEYYLIRGGATADWLAEKLIAARKRGVEVKLLLDGYGSFWIPRRWIRALRAGGVDVRFFLPARMILFQPMNLRNHRKIVVVDGRVGFTGGINIGDEYRGKTPWRDTHLAVEGPAVAELSHVFEQDWHFATRTLLTPAAPAPATEGEGLVAIVRSGPDMDGPKREAIHRIFFSAITRARERVYITTPYFIPDRSILVALQTAALRGVDVRLLFPKRSNHPFVWRAGRAFYEELLEAGVSIFEYGPGMIHAKTIVVDHALALVGSANMDLRSFRLNFEVHALVRDATTARDLARAFEADLAVSERVELPAFRARGWPERVLEGAARLLSPLM
jgi:cardiolipin synthase